MSRINPTVRGFAIILAIAGLITGLSLEPTLTALFFLVRIVFFVAIAYFLYRLWRERREEISTWPARSQGVLYGAVLLAVVNFALGFGTDYPSGAAETLVFVLVLVACGFAIWRVWRDEHTYS
ncbi:MAG: hypothetical protein R3C15_19225 [Thermoleophilia bacterium]